MALAGRSWRACLLAYVGTCTATPGPLFSTSASSASARSSWATGWSWSGPPTATARSSAGRGNLRGDRRPLRSVLGRQLDAEPPTIHRAPGHGRRTAVRGPDRTDSELPLDRTEVIRPWSGAVSALGLLLPRGRALPSSGLAAFRRGTAATRSRARLHPAIPIALHYLATPAPAVTDRSLSRVRGPVRRKSLQAAALRCNLARRSQGLRSAWYLMLSRAKGRRKVGKRTCSLKVPLKTAVPQTKFDGRALRGTQS